MSGSVHEPYESGLEGGKSQERLPQVHDTSVVLGVSPVGSKQPALPHKASLLAGGNPSAEFRGRPRPRPVSSAAPEAEG